MSRKKHNRNKTNKKLLILILIIIILLSVLFLGYTIYKEIQLNKNKAIYEDIDTNIDVSGNEKTITQNMKKVINLKQENEDVIGWIQIENTVIDYPILQSADNKYYLKRNYKKENTKYGSIYAKNECDIKDSNSNIVIYGHNMKDGQMFNTLLKYEDEAFYKEHKTIKIATENEESNYSIVAVFKSRIFYQDETNVFRYYDYINLEDENKYNEFIDNCKKIQLYDTGASAVYGEQLITLITCEYSQDNGRMVVVAKKES